MNFELPLFQNNSCSRNSAGKYFLKVRWKEYGDIQGSQKNTNNAILVSLLLIVGNVTTRFDISVFCS